MTVQNTNRKDVYLTNGTTIYWPYTFEIFTTDGSDLALYETNLTTGETVLIDTNFTRDIINSRIKYPRTGSPRPEGYKITVARVTERTQGVDLETQSFDPKNMERGLDKLTAMVQEIDETVSRAAVADISQQGVNFTFPSPVAGKVVGWNAEGTGLINLDNTTLGIEAQMLAATEAAQTAAEAAQTAADKVDSILEPDGVTVKEATHATSADSATNATKLNNQSSSYYATTAALETATIMRARYLDEGGTISNNQGMSLGVYGILINKSTGALTGLAQVVGTYSSYTVPAGCVLIYMSQHIIIGP